MCNNPVVIFPFSIKETPGKLSIKITYLIMSFNLWNLLHNYNFSVMMQQRNGISWTYIKETESVNKKPLILYKNGIVAESDTSRPQALF